ncbi:MAG: hypothetical protein GYB66_01075 [Chloroflexi bacterium]|nr:hypothetical protein [Chloroflexota bacterium]
MFGSIALDVAIGLIFVFFVMSSITSTAYSLISNIRNTRGKLLAESLKLLLDGGIYEQVMHHPLIRRANLKAKRLGMQFGIQLDYDEKPPYIDPETFSKVLADLMVKAKSTTDPTKVLLGDLDESLRPLFENLNPLNNESVEELVDDIRDWYNNAMNSLTKIFKEYTRMWLLSIATVATIFFNVNALVIAEALWQGPTLRDAVVEAADQRVSQENIGADEAGEARDNPVAIFQDDLAALSLPVGWTEQELDNIGLGSLAQIDAPERETPNLFVYIVGWILTISAASFGAPFWFDLLNKLVNLRAAVKPRE